MNMREARAMVKALRSTEVPAPEGLADAVMAGRRAGRFLDRDRGAHRAALRGLGGDRHHRRRALRRPRGLRDRVRAAPRPAAAPRAGDAGADAGGQVQKRFEGERTDGPDVDLDTLTEFEQAVLRKTMEIPYGEVRPYSWVAREIGRPRAVRAVGTALAGNPVTFVIPCHRVVRADGHIGNYGAGGPEAKREVLGARGHRHRRARADGRPRRALHR